ncbi:MAG: helix-turn-helix transcriptional regulator [Acidobacteriota bacterium]
MPNSWELAVGRRIGSALDGRGLQRDLARHLGVSESTVSVWLGGNVPESWQRLRILCDYLACSADQLLGVGAADGRRLQELETLETADEIVDLLGNSFVRESLKRAIRLTMDGGRTGLDDLPLADEDKAGLRRLRERVGETERRKPGA